MKQDIYQDIHEILSSIEGFADVFDGQAPSGQLAPYAVIGQMQESAGRQLNGQERKLLLTLHVWSSSQSRAEILAFCDAIEAALPDDYLCENILVQKDEASGLFHSTLTYRVYFDRRN